VVNITWYEALKYCHWLTARLRGWKNTPEPLAALLCTEGWQVSLPSEAEWEKAARGTDGRIYPWGNEPDANPAIDVIIDIGNPSSAVGCFPGGASPYGIEDMSGNVLEWTRSLLGKYPYPTGQRERSRRENLQADRNTSRVLRGGAFFYYHWNVRCASRVRHAPNYSNWNVGFRVVVLPCR
jgi:formylglycine-generating enzyme required for sulfatase activity